MGEKFFDQDALRLVLQARNGATIKRKAIVNNDMIALTIITNRRELACSVFQRLGLDMRSFTEQAIDSIERIPSIDSLVQPEYTTSVQQAFRESGIRDNNGNLICGSITTSRLLETILRHSRLSTMNTIINPFCCDWTALAAQGRFSPVVGREYELSLLERSLVRKTKNNPVLVGDAGVGKTAIVEGFALKIITGDVPARLSSMRLLSIDLPGIISESGPEGVKKVMESASQKGNIILFIDEFHCLIDNRAMNLANIIKPILARGSLKLIGATTAEEYSRFIESDKAFERRLQKIEIDELSTDDTVTVLNAIKSGYEQHHGVKYENGTIKLAVDLAQRYVGDKHQPDKSIDIIDEAGAKVSMSGRQIVTDDDIRDVLTNRTGIPVWKLCEDEYERLQSLGERLGRDVLGQESAVDAVAEAIKRNRMGIVNGHRPVGSFLFVGPTGVGKTELAKSLANHFAGNPESLIRIDMSEYQQEFSVSRLIGSPPGYVGYEQGGQLTEAVHRKPFCVVLLDEVEKAHPRVFELLLQVLDDGRLTDGRGRTIDFSNVMIILTSNLGTKEASNVRKQIGFGASTKTIAPSGDARNAVSRFFSPEFLNRLDGIIDFKPLDEHHLVMIARKKLEELRSNFMQQGYDITFDDSVVAFSIQEGANPSYGARPVRRAVENNVASAITDMILSRAIIPGKAVTIGVTNGRFEIQQ